MASMPNVAQNIIEGLKKQYMSEVEAMKAIQAEIAQNRSNQEQLMSQASENEMVLDELGRVKDDGAVFKLVGPALIRQDLVEAKSNVNKRVEYIKSEIERLNKQHAALEEKAKNKEQDILKLQKKVQSLLPPQSS